MNDQELKEVFDYYGKERLVDGKNGAIGKNKDLPVHVKSFYPPGELARKAKLLSVRFQFRNTYSFSQPVGCQCIHFHFRFSRATVTTIFDADFRDSHTQTHYRCSELVVFVFVRIVLMMR